MRREFSHRTKQVGVLNLFSEQPEDEGEQQTDQDAGNNREMETEVVAFVMDIAGQSAEPAATESAPEYGTRGGDAKADDDEEFSEVGHGFSLRVIVDGFQFLKSLLNKRRVLDARQFGVKAV